MSKQRVQAGAYIDFVDRNELDNALSRHYQAFKAHEDKLEKGVQRIKGSSAPAYPGAKVAGAVLIGGPDDIAGPQEGFAWAIHRISLWDASAVANTFTYFAIEIGGSAPQDATVNQQRYVANMVTAPNTQTAGFLGLSKGALTLFAGDILIAKATGVTSAGPFTLSFEGVEVPRHLLWKLYL
jgi:hypothetical protein